jgi:hypothetical protein
MALPAAQSALVVGLWSFGFFGLSCDFHSNTLLVDLFSIHFINSFLDSIFCFEDLGG